MWSLDYHQQLSVASATTHASAAQTDSVLTCLCVRAHRTSKPPLGTPRKIGQGCKFHSFTTNTYKMHFLESPSGIKVSQAEGFRQGHWARGNPQGLATSAYPAEAAKPA